MSFYKAPEKPTFHPLQRLFLNTLKFTGAIFVIGLHIGCVYLLARPSERPLPEFIVWVWLDEMDLGVTKDPGNFTPASDAAKPAAPAAAPAADPK
jgi:hypothetical protein